MSRERKRTTGDWATFAASPGSPKDGSQEDWAGNRPVAGAAVASVRDTAKNDLDWGGAAKGYLQEDFKEVFPRYIPLSEVQALMKDIQPPGGSQEKRVGEGS